jgi:peptide deformylase
MAIRTIISDPDDRIVRGKAKRVARIDDSIRRLFDDMIDTMRHAPGVGLAAPQIGVPLRVIVVEYEGVLHTVVNPEIVKSQGTETDDEGCLSVPNWQGPVTRATSLVVKGRDRDGLVFVHDPTGHGCACFEAFDYHHCDGIFGIVQYEMNHCVSDKK